MVFHIFRWDCQQLQGQNSAIGVDLSFFQWAIMQFLSRKVMFGAHMIGHSAVQTYQNFHRIKALLAISSNHDKKTM